VATEAEVVPLLGHQQVCSPDTLYLPPCRDIPICSKQT